MEGLDFNPPMQPCSTCAVTHLPRHKHTHTHTFRHTYPERARGEGDGRHLALRHLAALLRPIRKLCGSSFLPFWTSPPEQSPPHRHRCHTPGTAERHALAGAEDGAQATGGTVLIPPYSMSGKQRSTQIHHAGFVLDAFDLGLYRC